MKNIKLRTKLLLIVLISIIPMALLNSYMITLQHERAVDMELNANYEYAKAINRTFNNYVDNIWCAEYLIGANIVKNNSMNSMDVNTIETYLKEGLLDLQTIKGYLWVNNKGIVVASGGNISLNGVDLSDRDYFKRIISGEEKVVSDLFFGKRSQTPSFSIVRGIRVNGELKGIIVGGVAIDKLETIMPENRLGRTSSFGFVDRNGMIIFRSGTTDIPMEKRLIKDDSPIWKALKGENALIGSYNASIDNSSRMGANIPNPYLGWASFATIATEEVTEKISYQTKLNIIIMFFMFFISFALALYIVFEMLKPIKILEKSAMAMACRDFSCRTNLQRKDELGKTAEAFDKMAEHIQALEESRMLFLQTAAHELRNPMTSVKGITSLIHLAMTKGKPLSNSVQIIDILDKEVDRLAKLLNQILEAFSVEKENIQITVNMQPQDITEVIGSALKLYQMDPSNNRTIISNSPGPIWVLGDYNKLEDVIRNLLSNAVKYSPDLTEITINTYIGDDSAIVSVKDQGIGIPEEHLTEIFNSFYRVINVNERDPGGLGLGLYICKDIILRHGGSIWVENSKDNGCVFYIKLPLYHND